MAANPLPDLWACQYTQRQELLLAPGFSSVSRQIRSLLYGSTIAIGRKLTAIKGRTGNQFQALDVSPLPRLINMRLRRERKKCDERGGMDFYARLHFGRKLRNIRSYERKALARWCRNSIDSYTPQFEQYFTPVKTVEDELRSLRSADRSLYNTTFRQVG